MLLFFSLFAFINSAFFTNHFQDGVIFLNGYIAHLLINLFGESATFAQGSIISNKIALNVILDCCGLEPMVLFVSFASMYPSHWKIKFKGIILATTLLFAVNIVRIASLYFIGSYVGMSVMSRVHLDIWQVLYILLALFLCLFYIIRVHKKTKASRSVQQ